ncbi:MAG: carbohydrate-binding family 9-like protein, partial [Rikenellaceae bacterium]
MLVLKIKKPSSPEDIEDVFSQLPKTKIANVNWVKEFPYKPDVKFAIFHDGDSIYLRYQVDEQHTLARMGADNGEVWKDSCVEFFIALDDSGYYNFEFNSLGKGLVGFRQDRNTVVHGDDAVLSKISRQGTMGSSPFEERDDQTWELTLTIPKDAFFKHNLKT